MKTAISKFDPESRTVTVLFNHAGVKHRRAVKACLTEDGGYDAKATRIRVEEVAQGVIRKIELGAIGNEAPPLAPAPEETPPAE